MAKTDRSLSEILRGYSEDSQRGEESSAETHSQHRRFKSNEDEPSESDLKKFIEEMEGNDAHIGDISSLEDLLKHPQEGSIISVFKDPKRQTKSHVTKFATESFVPNIVPILFSDDIPMEIYVIFRLVLPHKRAIAAAEEVGKLAKNLNMTTTQVLAEISGMDIKQRSDLKKVLSTVLNYHPHIGRILGGFFTKMNIIPK